MTTCGQVSGLYTRPQLPPGLTIITRIPRGSCEVSVTFLRPQDNHLGQCQPRVNSVDIKQSQCKILGERQREKIEFLLLEIFVQLIISIHQMESCPVSFMFPYVWLWQYSNSNFCSLIHFMSVLKTAKGVYVINPPGEAGTQSGEWAVDGDPDTLVTYTRGEGDTREKAEIRGPLGVPLDLGVRNNKRSRWPVVTPADGSV